MLQTHEISLLIAIPCYGGNLTSETTSGLYKLAKHLERIGIFNELLLISNESLIPHGRATIANIFINDTNHTHLLMIDADVGFIPEDVIKLFELNTDFAAGAYPMKVIPDKYNFSIRNREINEEFPAVVVDSIGAGFCLVTRSVFTDIMYKYPELKYKPVDKSLGYNVSEQRMNNSYAYFETYIDPITLNLISEDFAFNKRWNSTGGKIWLHLGIQLTHTGSHVFHGRDLSNFR
jgi:hypothetical protein